MIRILHLLSCFFLLAISTLQYCGAQTRAEQEEASKKLPAMDGGAGPCSLLLTVTDQNGKPVYAADIKVHIAYGFGGIRKLDLDAGTNADGKVKFIGLPSRVRRPPLEFNASKDQVTGTATYDPAQECDAKHDIVLASPKPPESSGEKK